MRVLGKQRQRLGLSQSHAAFLLGTQQSNISAYERGVLEPGPVVSSRIEAFVALEPDTAHRGTWAGTLPSHAIALSAAAGTLTDMERDVAIVREVVAMHDAFTALTCDTDRALFLTEPTSTGWQDLDALLAGLAVHWCRGGGVTRVPLWTRDSRHYLATSWWVGADERMPKARARALAHGVPALRSRGIFLDRATLASV